MRRAGVAGRLLLSLAAAVSTLCAFALLDPVFAGPGWWVGPSLGVAAVAAAGALCQGTRLPGGLVAPVQLVALAIAVTGYYASDTGLLGLLPTPHTQARLVALGATGAEQVQTHTTPVPVSAGLTLLVTVCLGLLAVLIHLVTVTLRLPGLVGLALLALAFVPLAAHHEGVGWGAFTVAALGFLLLLAVDSAVRTAHWGPRARPGRSSRPAAPPDRAAATARHTTAAAAIAAAAVVLALLLPLAVPGMVSDAVYSLTSGLRGDGRTVTTVNPLTSLRHNLTSVGDRRVLEYHTDTSRPEYLRTHVLDTFDGESWTMSPVQASQRDLVDGPLPRPPGRLDASDAEEVTTRITVSSNAQRMDFLPLPYPTSDVRVSGDWFVDRDTLMVFSPHGQAAGLTYETTSRHPVPRREELAQAPPGGAAAVDQRYLALPDITERVSRLAESLTADADSPHGRAVALQDWFTGGAFDYDLAPPPLPDDADPLTHFLTDSRTGYCQHFASAMAVMARHLGIPARVAVGYTAGERVGADHWVVRERNAHAWPELYFEGQGWLRFEPTPSASNGQPSARVPAYAFAAPRGADDDGADDGGTERQEREAEEPEEEPSTEESAESAPQSGSDPARDDTTTAPGTRVAAVVAAAGGVLAALLAAPALLRRLVRRLRWTRAVHPAQQARAAWRELRDDLLDLGLGWHPAHSPRMVGHRLERDHGLGAPQRDALRRIVAAEESARYAPYPPRTRGLADDGRVVRRALAAARPPRARVAALLLPRSLWTRRRDGRRP